MIILEFAWLRELTQLDKDMNTYEILPVIFTSHPWKFKMTKMSYIERKKNKKLPIYSLSETSHKQHHTPYINFILQLHINCTAMRPWHQDYGPITHCDPTWQLFVPQRPVKPKSPRPRTDSQRRKSWAIPSVHSSYQRRGSLLSRR